jgi:hypothetical protein
VKRTIEILPEGQLKNELASATESYKEGSFFVGKASAGNSPPLLFRSTERKREPG